MEEESGWGGRIRTYECGLQRPVPYRLATPHHILTIEALEVWVTMQKSARLPNCLRRCCALDISWDMAKTVGPLPLIKAPEAPDRMNSSFICRTGGYFSMTTLSNILKNSLPTSDMSFCCIFPTRILAFFSVLVNPKSFKLP